MIDLQDLRSRPDAYQKAAQDKGIDISVQDFLKIDDQRKSLQKDVDDMRAQKNEVSKKVPTLSGDEKDQAIAQMKELNETLNTKEDLLKDIEPEWKSMQLRFPSVPLDRVPLGKDDTENVEIRTVGDVPSFDFDIKDHITLGQDLDLIDIPRGVKIAGSRSYFLKNEAVQLELAVLQFTLDSLIEKGYTPFLPPLMANYDAFMGTSYFPGGEEQAYAVGVDRHPEESSGSGPGPGPESSSKSNTEDESVKYIESDNHFLIGTSEVSVASYHSGETFTAADLPKRYCGISNCFRREAGTYGKDTHGLYRIHQFQKVEQVILCENDPEVSAAMHEEILGNAEAVLQALELPYRVVDVCTGDMGQGQIYKNDIETWMPSRESYGETHSCSTFHDFQARRLGIKYETEGGKKRFVHTLNNTCIASPRILIPILEIYQNADGSVTVPQALRKYMGGKERIG